MAAVEDATHAGATPGRRLQRPQVSQLATIAIGVGLAFIVVRDGAPIWQAVRFLVVVAVVGLVLLALAQRDVLVRVVVAFVLSLIAIPVGIGFGGPHLAKTGLTIETIAGLLVLIGGLTLFVATSASLVRSTRPFVGWPAIVAEVLTLLVFSATLGQAVAATNVPRTDVGTRTPADVGVSYEDVEFPATDGVRLSGWYIPSENGAAAMLLHGAGSTRSNVLDHAAVLARHGYGVLLYDARGHGRSDGRAMDFGWFGDQDIGGAVRFLTEQPDVDNDWIAAVGMSMGGEQVIGAAATIARIRVGVARHRRAVGRPEHASHRRARHPSSRVGVTRRQVPR